MKRRNLICLLAAVLDCLLLLAGCSAAAEDIAVGDLVVQTTADDGECRIIILQKAESAA